MLVGFWAIDVITIDGEDRKIDLSVNVISFDNSGYCRLPTLEFIGSNDGKWQMEKKGDDLYLVITLTNNALVGRYRLVYYKDHKEKLYRMSLKSDHIEMICSKGFQSFRE